MGNPFKNINDKIRNNLMFELLYYTGIRSSELLALRVSDISYGEDASIAIVRRHDSLDDPRKLQPTVKSLGRDISIPPALAEQIRDYIFQIRSKFPESKKHPFIFVSQKGPTKGKPISDETFRLRVLGSVKAKNESFEYVKRHGFRHYWNLRFSQNIDQHNEELEKLIFVAKQADDKDEVARLKSQLIKDEEEKEIRSEILGHRNEGSAKVYLKRHVKEKVNKVNRLMMDGYSKIVREERAKNASV